MKNKEFELVSDLLCDNFPKLTLAFIKRKTLEEKIFTENEWTSNSMRGYLNYLERYFPDYFYEEIIKGLKTFGIEDFDLEIRKKYKQIKI